MSREPKIKIAVGAFVPTIGEQLEQQGLRIGDHEMLGRMQQHLDCINRMRIAGLLADREVDNIMRRFIRRLAALAEELEQLEGEDV